MSRYLFVVPPLAGHINPAAAVGAELAARGHEVAWAGHPATLAALLPERPLVFPVVDDTLDAQFRAGRERWLGLRGAAVLKFFWEDFAIPLAHAMLPGVAAAITGFAPDVVVADQQALAGALAARRAGVAWATSATTPAELLRPLSAMPKVEEWVRGQINALQRDHGVTDPVDLRFSDQLVLVFSTPALVGDVSGFDGHYVFTGPALAARPDRGEFPWEWLDPGRRLLLVSLGTLNAAAGQRFFATATEALADLAGEVQAVMVTQPFAPHPAHILPVAYVPQLALLAHCDAVVCHGGHNTVCEALAHGLPLVVTPIRDDQPVIAQQVADAGAGVRLRFGRLRAAELTEAVRAVLDDPGYRAAAGRIRDSFTHAGGAATAADHLEKLA
ncbi:MAG TPA: nucleotide disphospho-sugar-binding domain-containing protein [Streptosporangiaceae bacterium]|nr:nucleotide disphospho-sugar-binding domain-containing protein [Streptosporangiaceae bacterium]